MGHSNESNGAANLEKKNNHSSLFSYLGWKGSRRTGKFGGRKNAVPFLMYFDIFKNYFANTQEEKFYIITGSTKATVTFEQQNQDTFTTEIGQDAEHSWNEPMNNAVTLQAATT